LAESTGKRTRQGSHNPSAITYAEPITTVTPTFAMSSQVATRVENRDGFEDTSHSGEDPETPIPSKPTPSDSNVELRYGERREIGRGGMARVYQVLDRDLNRNVAMKVLSCGKLDRDSEFRFVAEAQISGQLEHPALLPIHDIGIDNDGRSYFTMRYVRRHETLVDVIELLKAGNQEAHEIYTMKRRVQIIQRVCDALTYAHRRGVVHRDIKPSNILIGDTGEIYLADWGVACLLAQAHEDSIDTNLSKKPDDEGKIVGTPLYMSPEQLLATGEVTAKTDVYSLCAVAYELFSLTHYLGPNPPGSELTIYETITDLPRIDAEHYIHPVGGRVPRQLSRVLRHGLQHDRSVALATAEDFEDALQRWVEGTAPVVCPGTFIQSWLGLISRAIDRRPVAFPIFLIVLGGALTASIVHTALTVIDSLV
jgi:serine/threonine-protein kinase